MFKATQRLSLLIVCILALLLCRVQRIRESLARRVLCLTTPSYAGDCWYWDEQMHQWIGAARYQYDNWRHTNTDSTVRTFSPLTITYSGVCPDDNSTGSQYSADGWRMVINTPYNVTVFNQFNQQIYP